MYFQQGWLTLVKLCIGPLKGQPRTPGMDFFLYSAQASFSWPRVDLARLLRRAYSRPFWITSFEFVKVCGIRFSIWESFIGFYICCYPITTILACLFSVGVRISWKKLCWMRAWRRRWHLVSATLYIIIVYRVNLNKLSRNFVAAIRKTTTNCRVSFIDLYLVFPTNFRTEPGLPVSLLGKANLHEISLRSWRYCVVVEWDLTAKPSRAAKPREIPLAREPWFLECRPLLSDRN